MRTLTLLAAMAALLMSEGTFAQSTDPVYFGGKLGFSKPHGSDNDSGFNIFGVLGQKMEKNIYWEAELSLNLMDGDIGGGPDNDWSMDSIAGYFVYRTEGDLQLKAKLGVSYWDDNLDNDTNLSAGIGIGVRLGTGMVDVEYTQINPYADYITVGYILRF